MTEALRVCIGSGGRFHAFDLARQMNQRGHLARMYTAYPRWKTDDLPADKVSCFPWTMGPYWLLAQLRSDLFKTCLNAYACDRFDRARASRLAPCDVFHCLSSFGIKSHQAARARYGAITICDRGSSHIVFQDRILEQEFDRWGIPYKPTDPGTIERELREYEFCDRIFIPSHFAYHSFLEYGIPREKLKLVPYGVDVALFRPIPKEDNVFRVVYVGALSLRKGLPDLIEAVAPLSGGNVELLLIGPALPEIKPFLRKYEGKYRYIGPKPRSELSYCYSQCSIFVIASVEEGLALVQAQAMACGLPVIATTNTGADDLFTSGKEGFIVPIRSPEAIREKVLYLLGHPEERAEMSRAALERVSALGGWNTYGQRAEDVYRAALQQFKAVDQGVGHCAP